MILVRVGKGRLFIHALYSLLKRRVFRTVVLKRLVDRVRTRMSGLFNKEVKSRQTTKPDLRIRYHDRYTSIPTESNSNATNMEDHPRFDFYHDTLSETFDYFDLSTKKRMEIYTRRYNDIYPTLQTEEQKKLSTGYILFRNRMESIEEKGRKKKIGRGTGVNVEPITVRTSKSFDRESHWSTAKSVEEWRDFMKKNKERSQYRPRTFGTETERNGDRWDRAS